MREVVRRVGRYEILGELGRGGMAVVHLARQTDLDRHVALKELGAFRASDPDLVRRFVREAQLAASLTHPNIVVVHDFFEHDGLPYIAMELVERGSLRPRMGQLSLVQAIGVLEGMLAGLGHAADRGLVHRDVKPENVLVGADGRVKIADFGIARARDRLSGSTLTDPGIALGTPAYMSPEQAMAGEIGPWTDLYAVGAIAYEMVTGRLPLAGSPSPAAALLRLVSEAPPAPGAVMPALDAEIAAWIERMLARDPLARPVDAAAAWDSLEPHAIRLFGARWRSQSLLVDGATTRAGARPATPSPPPPPLAEPSRAPVPGPWTPPPGPLTPPLPESWPTQDAVRPVRPASPARPPTDPSPRARRFAPPPLAGVLSAALVAAIGFGSAYVLRGGEQAGSPPARPVANAAFELRLPAGWQRLAAVPRVPGLTLTQPLAVAPDEPAGASLVVGFADADGPHLLALDARRVSRTDRAPDVVALGALRALRHRDLALTGEPGTHMTLYAVPSDRGVATVACMATAPGQPAALAACERVATTLRLRTARAQALGPSAAYARSVGTILARLDDRRRRDGRALAAAATAPGQAAAATRVARAYAAAASALSALPISRADRPGHRRLVAAVRGAKGAFTALSSAARAGSARRYRGAAGDIARAVRSVDRAIAVLRSAGYTVSDR